jgi:type I site-specific restriction endonuclease
LLGSDEKPIAVVEAKRSSLDELAGKLQAADYADTIKTKFGSDPFIFLTNGKEIQFWERAVTPLARSPVFIPEMIWSDYDIRISLPNP